MPDEKVKSVKSLSEFIERVHKIRELWNARKDKELWFSRGMQETRT